MPSSATQGPNMGAYFGYQLDDDSWTDELNHNFKLIDRLLNCAVIDRNLSDPPASPSDGDTYIVGPTALNDWAGQEDAIAVYDGASSAWEFYTPKTGWIAFIVDEDVQAVFKTGAGWSDGISHVWA